MYLPQFHEFEENNRFWGKGFTEWTCVNRVSEVCEGHYIRKPHKDIGYYCLKDASVRQKQGEMAKEYGVYGFCYYHYWFGGKVLMQLPLELMLQDGYPDLPFCFSWANEAWTRRMNGGDGEVLVPCNYGSIEEWEQHLQYLLKFFRHKNYILVDNKPMLVIYRPSIILNFRERFEYWRKRILDFGFDGMFLVMTLGNFHDNFGVIGQEFDAAFESFPNFLGNPSVVDHKTAFANFYTMEKAYNFMMKYPKFHKKQFPGLMVGFDSYPRSPRIANIFLGSTPELFYSALLKKRHISSGEFLFVNGWNEWGEGATLEPDVKYGYGFLESVKKFNMRLKTDGRLHL